jgi:hypothetical protein
MPIRINLLAEAQALEEQRRRDPVKRVILIGVVLIASILAWSSSLMFKTMIVRSELGRLETELNSRTNEYHQVIENKRRLSEDTQKLAAIQQLITNRFLVGNFLNAFQQKTVDHVQLVHIKLDLNYKVEEFKTVVAKGDGKKDEDKEESIKPSSSKTAAPAKPPKCTEIISFALNAKDSSPNPGDAVNTFRDSLSTAPYFRDQLGKQNEIRLKSSTAPQSDPGGKPYVLFALEASLPEKTR